MKEVLVFVEQKKQEFAQLPLFEFLQDQSISPQQRLAWAPCVAPFVMVVAEMNKYFLREEPTNDPIQALVNKHTYEDDYHWEWYVQDIKTLGIGQSVNFSDTLTFLWSQETNIARWTAYEMYRYIVQATPIQKLAIIQVIEATGYVLFSASKQVYPELKYFGQSHLIVDSSHTIYSCEGTNFIHDIQLTEDIRKETFELVEKVFALIGEMINTFFEYAKNHTVEGLLEGKKMTDISGASVHTTLVGSTTH